ncbi:MAG: hypothetical protein P1V35_08235 [Planctomycetota bacterium]|nr:hypothetical protein [Planctomycetota bacterium]
MQLGYTLVGTNFSDPGISIGQGRLCLANSIGRYDRVGTPMNSIGLFDGQGNFNNWSGTSTTGTGFDVPPALPLPGNPTIATGQTWCFQAWHRDLGGQSSFSNGLAVTF